MRSPPSSKSLAARVARTCLAHRLFEPGERVLVAVSGGADSTALALLLDEARNHRLPLRLSLGHVEHGWRGPAAARLDLEVVERIAALTHAPLETRGPPASILRTEDEARRWRYRALEDLALRRGCTKVATGHHLRDQAETVLLRLLRGSGLVGLAGIPERRPLGEAGLEVVRPLLDVDPRALRAFLEARGVAWAEDDTNADLGRDRARVRERLLALEARGGAASRDLADLAVRLRRRVERREHLLEARIGGLVRRWPGTNVVEAPRALLADLPLPLLDIALRRLGRPIGAEQDGPFFTRRHLQEVARLLREEGAIDLPRGLHLRVAGGHVHLRREGSDPPPPGLAVEALGSRSLPPDVLRHPPIWTALVDGDVLGSAPRLRGVRAGDRFTPFGAEAGGPVDVLAWLARQGIPAYLRRLQWVVEGAGGVAWVVGRRIDRDHAVTSKTRHVVGLRVLAAHRPPA